MHESVLRVTVSSEGENTTATPPYLINVLRRIEEVEVEFLGTKEGAVGAVTLRVVRLRAPGRTLRQVRVRVRELVLVVHHLAHVHAALHVRVHGVDSAPYGGVVDVIGPAAEDVHLDEVFLVRVVVSQATSVT